MLYKSNVSVQRNKGCLFFTMQIHKIFLLPRFARSAPEHRLKTVVFRRSDQFTTLTCQSAGDQLPATSIVKGGGSTARLGGLLGTLVYCSLKLGGGGVAGICVSPQIWVPPTHIPRDICSPTQISLIIVQQWKVFPQGKMFPQVRWLCMG